MNTELLLKIREPRDRFENREDVLDKVKTLALLPDGIHAMIDMVAEYYEVGMEAMKSIIKDHRDELVSDGLKILQGDELRSFEDLGLIGKNTA